MVTNYLPIVAVRGTRQAAHTEALTLVNKQGYKIANSTREYDQQHQRTQEQLKPLSPVI